MLRAENKQQDFFDDYIWRRALPEKHVLLDIKERIDFSFVEEEVKDCYVTPTRRGRPPYHPGILFRILFLEYWDNLSDVEVCKQVSFNLLYRYFAGIPLNDEVPDDTTLVKFRNRLGEEKFKSLFDRIVEQALSKGLLKEKLKIIDATHINADAAVQGLVNLLRQGRRMVLRKIEKSSKDVPETLKEKYETKEKIYSKPSKEQIEEELNLTKGFIKEMDQNYSGCAEEITSLLKEVVTKEETTKAWSNKINTNKKRGRPKKSSDNNSSGSEEKVNDKSKREDRLTSFVDTDARFGHKSKKKSFNGYKAHASMDESGIVTSVQTFGGNENELTKLEELLEEDKDKGIKSDGVTADTLYDPAQCRRAIKNEGMHAFIPSRKNERQIDEGFEYCPQTDKVICSAGKCSRGKTRQDEGELYYFSAYNCKNCDNKNCQKKNMKRVRIYVSDAYKLRQDVDPEDKKEALIIRKAIEAKFGEAKKWHHLDRARYRSRCKTSIQVLMTFLVTNCKRIVKLLKQRWKEFYEQLDKWEKELKMQGN